MPDCCAVLARSAKHEIVCPECNQKGKKVPSVTVTSLVEAEFRPRISDQTYFFCEEPNCNVVYFSEDASSSFTKGQLSVRVGLKETVDPITVCYCFGHTVSSIRDEIKETGNRRPRKRFASRSGQANVSANSRIQLAPAAWARYAGRSGHVWRKSRRLRPGSEQERIYRRRHAGAGSYECGRVQSRTSRRDKIWITFFNG